MKRLLLLTTIVASLANADPIVSGGKYYIFQDLNTNQELSVTSGGYAAQGMWGGGAFGSGFLFGYALKDGKIYVSDKGAIDLENNFLFSFNSTINRCQGLIRSIIYPYISFQCGQYLSTSLVHKRFNTYSTRKYVLEDTYIESLNSNNEIINALQASSIPDPYNYFYGIKNHWSIEKISDNSVTLYVSSEAYGSSPTFISVPGIEQNIIEAARSKLVNPSDYEITNKCVNSNNSIAPYQYCGGIR